jgi:hypothetical protein
MTNNENKNQAIPVDLDALEALYSTMLDNIQGGQWRAANSNACAIADAAPALIGELRALRVDESMHVEVIGDLMAETTTLKAEIEKLREANRWRPIAEAPKDNAGIEAIDSRTGFVRVVDYYKGYPLDWTHCWALQGASNECYPLDYFTHWRPIPDPPEGA